MASTVWIMLGAVACAAIIANMIVRIVRISRSGGGMKSQMQDMEVRIDDLCADLDDARKRIEVLEKIVTDQKYDLGREIGNL